MEVFLLSTKHSVDSMKNIIVTGGTRGIGRAIVARFLNDGFRVFTCGSSEESVRALLSEFSGFTDTGHLIASKVDVSEKEQIFNWIRTVERISPSIEVLVNNAGIFFPGNIESEEEGVFEKTMAINLASAYHCSRMVLPLLHNAEMAHIFNMCSTASIIGYPNGGSYCISKFGLLGMNKVLREELKPTKIRVTAILPGATLTDSWSASGLPTERFMKPEDVAEAVFSAWSMSPFCDVEEILLRPQAGDIL